ncbi:flagellar hook-length control protein FliK [Bradyrhizobium sp. Ai1a-2]|uniref:flagellar hook-length control protein FliK n=1 Tax=Bradyrhizobium sp. Ai1a-2 TaxID=196490 RepID=UPI000418ED7D|nr:flagellar hook-length control protein FliK [Bradyrhizobium sp. Ai1a-2]
MVNVAQEALAGMSFQANSPRSARPDSGPAPGNDSFGALVDGNTAARDNRPDDSSREPPASARRNDDAAPAADTRSRDDGAGPDRPERNDVDARNDAGSSDRADKPDQPGSKSDTPKSDSAKSSKPKDDAPTKDDAKDGEESKQDNDGTAATTVIAATVSAVVASPANAAPATPPVSDTATAPLATAAAAIAAVASVAGTAPAAANAATTDAQADAQANGKAPPAVSDSALAVGDTAAIDIALSAAAASPTPQAKATAQSKPTLTTKDAIPTSGEQDSTTDSAPADAPTGIVPDISPPAAAAGKQKAEHAFVDAVKADASGNSAQTPAANAASHAQAGTANAAQTLIASDNSAQAAALIQPPAPSTPTTPSANSQLTVTAATTHSNAVPVSGLAMEIAASAKSGKSRFEIRLDPPELGRIDVRIHVDNNGQVTSHLTVERPETLQMLRQDANQLQRALDNAGLSTGNSGLQFSLRDQSSSGQNGGHQPNPNAHRLIVSEEDSVPATVAGRSYGRMLGASGGVDIRV